MKIKDKLAVDIQDFCLVNGISESKFGLEVAHTHKLLKRVREGSLTVNTMQKIYDYIDTKK